MTKQKPVETIRDGALSASIWKNDGENGAFYNVTLQRVFTDAEDNVKNSESFGQADLLKLSRLCHKSYDKIDRLRQHDRVDEQAA